MELDFGSVVLDLLWEETQFFELRLWCFEYFGDVSVVNDSFQSGAECLMRECLDHEAFVFKNVADVILKFLIAFR